MQTLPAAKSKQLVASPSRDQPFHLTTAAEQNLNNHTECRALPACNPAAWKTSQTDTEKQLASSSSSTLISRRQTTCTRSVSCHCQRCRERRTCLRAPAGSVTRKNTSPSLAEARKPCTHNTTAWLSALNLCAPARRAEPTCVFLRPVALARQTSRRWWANTHTRPARRGLVFNSVTTFSSRLVQRLASHPIPFRPPQFSLVSSSSSSPHSGLVSCHATNAACGATQSHPRPVGSR